MTNRIFEVDIKGLRQLQEGKPKWFIVRELLQNAMDEPVKHISLQLTWEHGTAHIWVEDDSPIGFRDLADIYTLFGDTYKREDATKRGRFNFGEKQVLVMADYARIESTTGGYEFDMKAGEKVKIRKKREVGSMVYIRVRMTRAEFDECRMMAELISPPPNMTIMIDAGDSGGEHVAYKKEPKRIHKVFTAKLLTEVKKDDSMRRVTRETDVYVYDERVCYLYELGIPVCEIDCDYSIDVQQRVPLSTDRDTVPDSYLKTLYGEMINEVYEEITKENASAQWVRQATESERSNKEAVQTVITTRFGDKALIANTFDRRSMDEAISNNYNVIHGSEMSAGEWAKIKEMELLQSTSERFKTGIAEGRFVKMDELTPYQFFTGEWAKKVALEILNINIKVSFYHSDGATVMADFNSSDGHLRFNLAQLDAGWWSPLIIRGMTFINQPVLDLIIHELGHSAGMHYEHSYHECLTELGSKLTLKAITHPSFFLIGEQKEKK